MIQSLKAEYCLYFMQQLLCNARMHRCNYSLWCSPWGNLRSTTYVTNLSALFLYHPLHVGSHKLSWASLPRHSVMAAFWVSGGGSGTWLGWQVAEPKRYAHDVTHIVYDIILELTNDNVTNLSVVVAFWALGEASGTWLGPQQSGLWLHWAALSFSAQWIAPRRSPHPWLFVVWHHQNIAPIRVVQGRVSPWWGQQNTFGRPWKLRSED